MPVIEEHKNVIISFGGGSDTFSCPINIDFVPDEVIVKGISSFIDNTSGVLTVIKTDLINEQFLGFYNDANTVSSVAGAVFTLKKPIRGTYTFKLLSITSGVNQYALIAGGADLCIHLDFVKYRPKEKY